MNADPRQLYKQSSVTRKTSKNVQTNVKAFYVENNKRNMFDGDRDTNVR